jgi:tetratricopeptide (TPR) repeat protein
LVYERMGDLRRAGDAAEQAITLFRMSADRYHEAETLIRLGSIRMSTGDADAAATAWQRAMHIFDELGDALADDLRSKLTEAWAPEPPAVG